MCEGDTPVPPPGSKSVYGVGIILSAPTFHFQSLLGPQAIRAHRTTHVISSPRDFIPRVLSRLHSTGTWASYLVWSSRYISESQMSVPTWQIRKLRLQGDKEFFPGLLILFVEEKVFETRSSDPKSHVLCPPLAVIGQVTTNKAQSSPRRGSIPGRDLCLSFM